jgi:hypothetical protein
MPTVFSKEMGENEYRNWQRQFESVFPPVITYDALVEALESKNRLVPMAKRATTTKRWRCINRSI